MSVEFTKPFYKKASVRIPDTVKINGITCKVTGISANDSTTLPPPSRSLPDFPKATAKFTETETS